MSDSKPKQVRVAFDSRVFALPVIKQAVYRFLKTFTADITQDGDEWVCLLTFADGVDPAQREAAERELRAEVLDQDLRITISRETEAVRNAVLALAFSRTGLQG